MQAIPQTKAAKRKSTWYRLAANGPVTKAELLRAADTTWESARNMLYNSHDRHHWTHTEHGYALAPCPNCHSTRRSPALIPEPHGLVCLPCETDEAGEHWPLDTYGKFVLAFCGQLKFVTAL